jgi:Cu/Ag efflux protein CusF
MEDSMKSSALLIPMLLAVALVGGVAHAAAPAATPDGVLARHTMDGTVTKVDAKRGWVDVKTSEGSMKLHFPSASLYNVKAGDSVTVELGMMPVPSGPDHTSKTK